MFRSYRHGTSAVCRAANRQDLPLRRGSPSNLLASSFSYDQTTQRRVDCVLAAGKDQGWRKDPSLQVHVYFTSDGSSKRILTDQEPLCSAENGVGSERPRSHRRIRVVGDILQFNLCWKGGVLWGEQRQCEHGAKVCHRKRL